MKPSISLALIGSLLLLVLPIALGFLVSLAWFTILSVPCASLAVIWLMSSRISPIMEGFPFLHPLGRQETGAVLISGLVAALGSASLALCAHLGPGYRLSTLIFALWTWLFMTRVAGLLARRYFVRVHASEHRSTVQTAGPSNSE